MKETRVITISLYLFVTASAAWAETATPREAQSVAERYLQLVTARSGGWGDAAQAQLGRMRELRSGKHLLAYVFDVEPDGFMVVSRHKEIAAVKAFSPLGRLDPEAQGGLAALIREELDHTVRTINKIVKKSIDDVTAEDWQEHKVEHYRKAWDYLSSPSFEPSDYANPLSSPTAPGMNYQEGDVMLDSHWHQKPPYNNQCPDLGCDWSGWPFYGYNTRALVGCVATAGAQITRYWAWPTCAANGSYVDRYWWTNMPSIVTVSSPQDQIDCVAAASRSVGDSVGMNYGCDGSSASTANMEQLYQNRRYHPGCSVISRDGYNTASWFNLCKAQCNDNQPSQYRVKGHSIVLDGWREVWLNGQLQERWLHMNYGWQDSNDNAWYLMNTWPLYDGSNEYIVRGIRPDVSLWDTLSGYYARPSSPGVHYDRPARYFNRDASGTNAEFQAGHGLQYLRPGFWLRNTGGPTDALVFHGAPSNTTEFYHRAPFGDVRIRILDGALKIYGGGEICFR